MQEYITTKAAAAYYGVSRKTVLSWIELGKMPAAQKFGRDWMIPKGTPRPEDKRYVENPVRNRRKSPSK